MRKVVQKISHRLCASVGADPKPVRIFNPLLQSEKFDPDATFIKKYLPELVDIDPKKIHSLELQ